MKKIALLLLALAGCLPKPQSVEAPSVITVGTVDSSPTLDDGPKRTIHWAVSPLHYETVSETISSREVKYSFGGTTFLVTSMRGSIITECSAGTSSITVCNKDGGTFILWCDNLQFQILCEVREDGKVIPKKEPEPAPVEPEPEPDPNTVP